jgi:hypothetical protein
MMHPMSCRVAFNLSARGIFFSSSDLDAQRPICYERESATLQEQVEREENKIRFINRKEKRAILASFTGHLRRSSARARLSLVQWKSLDKNSRLLETAHHQVANR